MVGKFIKKKILNVSKNKGNRAQNHSELAFLTRKKNSIIYQNILFLLIMHAFVPAEGRRGQTSVSGPTWEFGLETHWQQSNKPF